MGVDSGVTVLMRHRWPALALALGLVAAVVAGCAPKRPLLTAPPRYPDFPFPAVPPEFLASPAAVRHENAWVYLQLGDLQRAEQEFHDALDRAPSFYPAQAGLGYVRLAQRDYARAVDGFDDALQRAPAYVPALVGRAEALIGSGNTASAIEALEAALAADASLIDLRRRVQELRFNQLMAQVADARRAADAGRYADARRFYERVIQASPDSAFLYLELARVEQQQGDLGRALEHAHAAARLDPSGATALRLQGELHEARGELDAAETAYVRAEDLDPSDDVAARLARVRARARLALLPDAYRAIPKEARLTRGQLAALIGVRFEPLLREVASAQPVILTDTRQHWATSWIQSVAAAGVIDPNVNHQFQPERPITRADLAQVLSRLLDLMGPRRPVDSQGGRGAPPAFSDMSPSHLSYPAATRAVSVGLLSRLDDGSFQPTRVVAGAEAIEALDRLETLAQALR